MDRPTPLDSTVASVPGRSKGASPYRWGVALGFCAIVTSTVIVGYYVLIYREAAGLRAERVTLQADRAASDAALDRLQKDFARLSTESLALRREVETSRAEHAGVARRIEKLERLLSAQFGRLVQAEMMVVSSAADRMSVALAVPALFSTRDHLTKSGRSLLCQLARTIMSEYKGQLRVTGYYGKPRLSPGDFGWRATTPWHLSAARASSAAEALEQECGIPAERFFVVSYGPREAGPLGENLAIEFIFKPED